MYMTCSCLCTDEERMWGGGVRSGEGRNGERGGVGREVKWGVERSGEGRTGEGWSGGRGGVGRG